MDFYSKNATLAAAGKKAMPGEMNGHTKNHIDEVTFTQNVLAVGDYVHFGKLPKGAKILSVLVLCPSLGATGIFNLGFAATETAVEDDDALVASVDVGGQQVKQSYPILGDALTEEKELIAKFTEASAAANTLKLKVVVQFVVD